MQFQSIGVWPLVSIQIPHGVDTRRTQSWWALVILSGKTESGLNHAAHFQQKIQDIWCSAIDLNCHSRTKALCSRVKECCCSITCSCTSMYSAYYYLNVLIPKLFCYRETSGLCENTSVNIVIRQMNITIRAHLLPTVVLCQHQGRDFKQTVQLEKTFYV